MGFTTPDLNKQHQYTRVEEYLFEFVTTPEGREKIAKMPVNIFYLTDEEWAVKKQEQGLTNSSPSLHNEFVSPEEALEQI
mmetsp:Transcript_28700/g.43333  ORF Transcript_28700/g.43333 Transcript_28700/m.43333 type:complete len:80 (-) Transcript_28700:32-271(-)